MILDEKREVDSMILNEREMQMAKELARELVRVKREQELERLKRQWEVAERVLEQLRKNISLAVNRAIEVLEGVAESLRIAFNFKTVGDNFEIKKSNIQVYRK